jgi:hypothetical protein
MVCDVWSMLDKSPQAVSSSAFKMNILSVKWVTGTLDLPNLDQDKLALTFMVNRR